MNQLLSYPYDEKDINMMATPLISISAHNKEIIDKIGLPDVFITIAIGGRDHKRTFNLDGVMSLEKLYMLILILKLH